MVLSRLFARKPDPAKTLYEAIVAVARQPEYYTRLAVPDTVDGRFDLIVLHMFLVLERLYGKGAEAEDMRQGLTDAFFRDMDRSLREMGVGDLSVAKKVRTMAEAFYGRVKAYADAARIGEQELSAALSRNIYPGGGGEHAFALARWVIAARHCLAEQPIGDILEGKVLFQ